MRFSEDGICELDSITTVDECDAYVAFLYDERARHIIACDRAWDEGGRMSAHKLSYWRVRAQFEQSAARRHQQDIDGIDRLVPKIQAHKATLEMK